MRDLVFLDIKSFRDGVEDGDEINLHYHASSNAYSETVTVDGTAEYLGGIVKLSTPGGVFKIYVEAIQDRSRGEVVKNRASREQRVGFFARAEVMADE